jgi:ketosteroid isomerase-like protein
MNMTRVALSVVLMVASCLAACQSSPADVQRDESAVREVFESYIKSVNTADVTLASAIWQQSEKLVAITPFGRFQGWDRVRDEIYIKFLQQSFSARDLRPSSVSIDVLGDSAWLAYDWTFTGKLANGQPIASKGWESQMYQKTDQGWKIVHLHYSVPPPPAPSIP